jgi:hypothetical protein
MKTVIPGDVTGLEISLTMMIRKAEERVVEVREEEGLLEEVLRVEEL